jgi:hypothetical protein
MRHNAWQIIDLDYDLNNMANQHVGAFLVRPGRSSLGSSRSIPRSPQLGQPKSTPLILHRARWESCSQNSHIFILLRNHHLRMERGHYATLLFSPSPFECGKTADRERECVCLIELTIAELQILQIYTFACARTRFDSNSWHGQWCGHRDSDGNDRSSFRKPIQRSKKKL